MNLSSFSFLLLTLFSFSNCNSQTAASAIQQPAIYTQKSPTADGIGKVYMGREIAHVMGVAGADWLERNSRPQEENTQLAIGKMNLKPTDVVADIGAGTGYYTFKMAQKVASGKVYAVDIQDEMIQYLNNRMRELHATNVVAIKGGEQSPNLPDSAIDLAIMVDVYHELSYPHEMLQAIRKSLKRTGKLLLLEYKAEDPSVAIKPLHKMSTAQVDKELSANGFTLSYKGEFLPLQHFLLYQKK